MYNFQYTLLNVRDLLPVLFVTLNGQIVIYTDGFHPGCVTKQVVSALPREWVGHSYIGFQSLYVLLMEPMLVGRGD